MTTTYERDPQRDATMASLYATGATLQEIGDVFCVSRERVRQIIRREGVVPCGARPADPRTVLCAARAPGVTRVSQAAHRACVSSSSVERVLRELGCWPAVRRLWRWRRNSARRQRCAAWLAAYRVESARLGRPLTAKEIIQRGGDSQSLFGRHYVVKIRRAVGESDQSEYGRRYARVGVAATILALASRAEGVRRSEIVAVTGTTPGSVESTVHRLRASGRLRTRIARRGRSGESTYEAVSSTTEGQ